MILGDGHHEVDFSEVAEVFLVDREKAAVDYRIQAGAVLRIVAQETENRLDSLTGLKNHRAFRHDFPTLIEQSRDEGWPLALVRTDLDNLKALNDHPDYGGHDEGDRYLRVVAETLSRSIEPGDDAYRFGTKADEFGALIALRKLKGQPGSIALNMVERIGRRLDMQLNEAIFEAGFPADLYLGVSIGYALLQPEETGESLLKRADGYMYENKAERKHRIGDQSIIEARPVDFMAFDDPDGGVIY